MTRAFRAVIGLLLLAAAIPAHADDWPMLGGRPDRNLVSSEKGLPVTFDADKQQKIERDEEVVHREREKATPEQCE